MADLSSIQTHSEHLAVGGGAAGTSPSSSTVSGNLNWDVAGGMDQITVVIIEDTHIEDQSHVWEEPNDGDSQFYECPMPSHEVEVVAEEDEGSVYVIEYSNPEEEGESFQFPMSGDRSLPVTRPGTRSSAVRKNARGPLSVTAQLPKQRHGARQEKLREEDDVVMGDESVLELGESSGKRLVCPRCPPPRPFFKRACGLAIHLRRIHNVMKDFFCVSCQQSVRTQLELDTHTKRHAHEDAVFTCHLCSAESKTGFQGSRMGIRNHLAKEHPRMVPRCDICNKGFKTIKTYLADQFRHVGKSPYYCPKCRIYEMTERGFDFHMKKHDKKEESEPHMPTLEASADIDNSTTDDSDF